jgi:hypothetical protein
LATPFFATPYEQTSHLRLKFGEDAIEGLPARIEYDGPIGVQRRQFQADGLAHAAFETVAFDSFAQGFGRRETDARTRARQVREAEGREKRTRIARPLIVNLSEIAGAKQPDTFGKTRFRGVGDPGYLSELTVSFLRP